MAEDRQDTHRRTAPQAARPAGRLRVQRRRRTGDLRRQGALDPQARGVALLEAAGDGIRRSATEIASIDFLVTETEAEALLAEQQFIKRHRPRFNIRLRDDKSYPYVGVSLDEEFPRVYFTRERHRPGPGLLRPLLEREAGARDARPARQAVPVPDLRGPRARPPLRRPRASTTTSSAARRPASATSTARSTVATSTRSSTSSPAATASRARPGARDGRGRRGRGVRARGDLPRPPRRRSAR